MKAPQRGEVWLVDLAQNLVTIPHAKLLRVLGRLPAPQLAMVEGATAL